MTVTIVWLVAVIGVVECVNLAVILYHRRARQFICRPDNSTVGFR